MDAPQWYNSRLWSTNKQSIDGKPFKPPLRPQSASTVNNRPGFTIQPLSNNWSNFMRGQNMSLSNREQGYTFRYSNPYRQVKSTAVNKQPSTFSSKYYNSLSPNFTFSIRNNDRIGSAQIRPKYSLPVNTSNESKIVIKPVLLEFDRQIINFPTTEDSVHGNINSVKNDDDKDSNSETELSPQSPENVAISQAFPVPQNTPRPSDVSSLIRQPTKSILKKVSAEFTEPKVPAFTVYNNFYPSFVRTLSASSKSLITPQVTSFADLRKSLQSAPGSKREVRFDMTFNNVIEYSPNDCEWNR